MAREIIAYGLIAGLRYHEIIHMTPGMVMDLFRVRREYDMTMHGMKEKKNGGEW